MTKSGPARRFRTASARMLAGAAGLAIIAATSGTAVALVPYSVHLKVPATVKKGHALKVTAYGNSANLGHLTVWLAGKKCAPTASRERALKGTLIISQNVVDAYSKSKTVVAKVLGKRYACAYLTAVPPNSLTYAKASKAYKVIP